ncbi:ATP-binding protein [Lentzea sp. NBRC 102530]|uniref:ATP-binding protein n=1 Tax=Lentzea sp. NBRC 102530 TaxID=3032201 RepID=UPI0024A1CF4C|nr:ATP-binding protein [Lentzea sp. NBRC 102530]GLY47718.1 hypothetical protein Lesp01_13740 [Lentzea sp. NBRC 102530]
MPSLGHTLRELRLRSFTGRDDEVALFRDALGGSGVVFVHGPGGVGKSTLLDVFAEVAAGKGVEPVRIDARHLALGRSALPAPADAPSLLFLDTYELLEPLDDWIREHYLPSLPASCLVVIAGRRGPGPRWRADPAWRTVMEVVALGNLSERDGRAYLCAQEVPEEEHERLLKISSGHPLTLSMVVDAVRRGASPRTLADLPGGAAALLTQLIGDVPSARHRTALEVCALLLVTTEDLLRTLAGDDTGELFAWLRAQVFVDESPYGLYPHDVVRDAVVADLRWRDPSRYADLYRRKLALFQGQVRATADERHRLDLMVMTVVLNGTRSRFAALASLPPTLRTHADSLREGDQPEIVAMTARWQGHDQAASVARWLQRRPEAFRVFRTGNGAPQGFGACLDLAEADLGADPRTDAMWWHAEEFGPPRAGERVRAWRFFLDRDHGQRPSPSLTLFVAWQMLEIVLIGDDTAWTFVDAFEDGALWTPALKSLGFRAVGASSRPLFARDWRRADVEEYTDLLHANQIGAPVRQEPGEVLSRPEFTEAVRSALRALHSPELLHHNPLLRSRMVARHGGAGRTPAESLRELLEDTAAGLKPEFRVLVERTFLRPVGVQERVAESLHLSFNTYRRHRDKAVTHLTELLWERDRR